MLSDAHLRLISYLYTKLACICPNFNVGIWQSQADFRVLPVRYLALGPHVNRYLVPAINYSATLTCMKALSSLVYNMGEPSLLVYFLSASASFRMIPP